MAVPRNLDLCFENSRPHDSIFDHACEAVDEELYAAIPAASKVLELGCVSTGLGERFKRLHPGSMWVIHQWAIEAPGRSRLDAGYDGDIDFDASDSWLSSRLAVVGSGYDCVVLNGLLGQVVYPHGLLQKLHNITTPDATVVCHVANLNHYSVIERLLMGDTSFEQERQAGQPHLRSFSCGSLFKLLLDAGWLPALHIPRLATPANGAFASALLSCTRSLHITDGMAHTYLFSDRIVVVCKRIQEPALETKGPPFTVIVPVTNEVQLQINLLRSPGLKEIDAEIVAIRNATSAADAFARGRAIASHPWVLFCHQDVYFPAGTGRAISRQLETIEPQDESRAVLGFAGIANEVNGPRIAGLVVDRIFLIDHPATDSAISIDELCVVLHRSTEYKLDADLGWHLWATDLCMQSLMSATAPRCGKILRVPLFHNSVTDTVLPASYGESKVRILAKYPSLQGFITLCGAFTR